MATEESERALIEGVLGRPVAEATQAAWGFQNRTDLVTLGSGDRVVVQRYRRRQDAEYRLWVMRALWRPAAEAGIAIPRVREADLDTDPAWVILDVLPGVPVPEAGDAGLEGPRFPAIALAMGELLASFRRLPPPGWSWTTGGPTPAAWPPRRAAGPSGSPGWQRPSAPRWLVCLMACRRCSRSGRWCSPTATSRR